MKFDPLDIRESIGSPDSTQVSFTYILKYENKRVARRGRGKDLKQMEGEAGRSEAERGKRESGRGEYR